MSRCFPFPPPGYEKKPRSENVDLLAKEKHKEKKHKKEKRDKEKREGKERKDRDGNKDRHKEKKDRKEKHKDKKKDKHKDKSRSSEDRRTEEQTECHHEDTTGECSQKAEEVKDFKFTEDLGRRIKDEEKGAANRMLENVTSSFQRNAKKSSTATVVEKRVAGNEMLPNHTGTMQRRNDGMGHPADNIPCPIQRRIEGMGSGIAMQKERSASSEVVPNSISSGERGNIEMGLSAENSTHSIQRRSEGPCVTTASEKERGTGDKIVSKARVTVQRAHDGMGRPAESPSSFSSAVARKIDGVGLATAPEKERGNGNQVAPINIFTEQRRNDGLGKSAAKDADKKIEEKEKTKEREVGGKGEKRKDGDRDKKNKGKDKDRHKEKKDKIKDKSEHKHKEQHKPRDSVKKDQNDSLNIKQLAPEKDNGTSAGSDETAKKRKDFEINGFLHDKDVRPNKFSRTPPSSDLPVENGRTLELSHVAAPYSSIKPGVISNNKPESVLEIKDQRMNGTTEAKPSSADSRHPIAVDTREKAKASLKPPHRDDKYLNLIYSVPKMEEWPEFDDQEWLFSRDDLRPKPKTKFEAEETPHVWAEALRIESEDVIALPYVIPF